MCSYIACVLGNWNRIIVLNVQATVGSAWGYSVVRRWMKVVNASGIGSGFSHACSKWFDNQSALLNSSWSAVSHSSSNVGASGDQYPSCHVSNWFMARKKGRLCPQWTIVEENWATTSVELNRHRQTTSWRTVDNSIFTTKIVRAVHDECAL